MQVEQFNCMVKVKANKKWWYRVYVCVYHILWLTGDIKEKFSTNMFMVIFAIQFLIVES